MVNFIVLWHSPITTAMVYNPYKTVDKRLPKAQEVASDQIICIIVFFGFFAEYIQTKNNINKKECIVMLCLVSIG